MAAATNGGRKVSARLRIELPPTAWIDAVSTAFPTATFRLLAGMPTECGAMHLGEVRAERPADVADALRDHPAVVDYENLHASTDRTLARYEADETGLYEFVEHAGVVPDYPVVVRNGWFTVDITDTRERVTAIRDRLEAAELPHELVSIVALHDGENPQVTARQREALDVALQAGYFEVPRESTLAEVAEVLDVDTSTASGLIRRGVGTLVEAARAGPRGHD